MSQSNLHGMVHVLHRKMHFVIYSMIHESSNSKPCEFTRSARSLWGFITIRRLLGLAWCFSAREGSTQDFYRRPRRGARPQALSQRNERHPRGANRRHGRVPEREPRVRALDGLVDNLTTDWNGAPGAQSRLLSRLRCMVPSREASPDLNVRYGQLFRIRFTVEAGCVTFVVVAFPDGITKRREKIVDGP